MRISLMSNLDPRYGVLDVVETNFPSAGEPSPADGQSTEFPEPIHPEKPRAYRNVHVTMGNGRKKRFVRANERPSGRYAIRACADGCGRDPPPKFRGRDSRRPARSGIGRQRRRPRPESRSAGARNPGSPKGLRVTGVIPGRIRSAFTAPGGARNRCSPLATPRKAPVAPSSAGPRSGPGRGAGAPSPGLG
jgi:hypothetical protein